MNHDGKCMANRTFWGYYQGNWRKWPTVVAAERAAAFESQMRQSPEAVAPSSVLPKPEDEARAGNTPGSSLGSAGEASSEDSPDPTGETSSSRIPRDDDDPSRSVLPEPAPVVRPKLPGSALDDPAPTPPVDPNDRVPSLPPNLRNMRPPADSELELDNLFKKPSIPTPKPASGEAAAPRTNAPASANLTPQQRIAEHRQRLREHNERNRQHMTETNANLKATPANKVAPGRVRATTRDSVANQVDAKQGDARQSSAAANVPSAASTLDDLTTLPKAELAATGIAARSEPTTSRPTESTSETSDESATDSTPVEASPQAEPDAPPVVTQQEAVPAFEVSEQELLLTPDDTAASANPLRENLAHARYAARMFTPQVKAEASGEKSQQAATLHGSENPLRRRSSATAIPPANKPSDVVTVSYEVEAASQSPIELSPAPMATTMPMPVAAADTVLRPKTSEPAREVPAPPVTHQRKSLPADEPPGNVLRDETPPPTLRGAANPLRASSGGDAAGAAADRRAMVPAKTPGTGRYLTSPASPAPEAAPQVEPTPALPIPTAPNSLETANPLRAGL